jgi:hypothetical protein
MVTRTALAALLAFLAAPLAQPAQAALLDLPVPGNAFISYQSLQWAWGGPCPHDGHAGCAGGDLLFQATQGWRLPTLEEILTLPEGFALNFVFDGANVPLGGSDPVSNAQFLGDASRPGAAACAAPYFSTSHTFCDWGDGEGNAWATGAADQFYEQLYVRVAAPEPGSLALLAAPLLGVGLLRRRSR